MLGKIWDICHRNFVIFFSCSQNLGLPKSTISSSFYSALRDPNSPIQLYYWVEGLLAIRLTRSNLRPPKHGIKDVCQSSRNPGMFWWTFSPLFLILSHAVYYSIPFLFTVLLNSVPTFLSLYRPVINNHSFTWTYPILPQFTSWSIHQRKIISQIYQSLPSFTP